MGTVLKRPGRRKRWLLMIGAVVAMAVLFRQGLVPLFFLPAIDLSKNNNWFVDWRLAEIRRSPNLCRAVLVSSQIKARQIADSDRGDGCGWRNAVSLSTVAGARLPASRLTCEAAAALTLWMAHEVQPLAKKLLGSRVVSVRQMGTYACRNIIGTKIWANRRSQHASANAIDIGAFTLANGKVVSVKTHWKRNGKESRFLHAVHTRACKYFRVSLGPDYNAAHHDHFHFDRGTYSTCR